MTSYTNRLRIPLKGDSRLFYTKSGTPVATGYTRVVIGDRGHYIEFTTKQIIAKNFHIPKEQEYRKTDKCVYYIEARSRDASFIKLYYQRKTVKYADYKVGMVYISPFELKTDEIEELVTPLEK